MTGIELIAQERAEQIEKHGISVEDDKTKNQHGQLSHAVRFLCQPVLLPQQKRNAPFAWNFELWTKMVNKPYKERLIIAGALLAAEIDRTLTYDY